MHPHPRTVRCATALAVGAIAAASWAQAPESELPPEPGQFEGATLPRGRGLGLPEVSDRRQAQNQVEERGFTLKPGLVLLADFTFVNQDATSVAQVGQQEDEFQPRAARLLLRGTLGTTYQVRYLVAGEYKGFDGAPDRNWDMTDVSLTFPLRGPDTTLTVGKTKQTHVYEMVGDAANLPQQERVLNPFFASRSVGLRLNHVTTDRRSTFAIGIYNDSWAGSSSTQANDGTDVTARATHALWLADGGRHVMHLGASVRYWGDDGGTLRYRGRPESNVLDYFVDTGAFAADHALHGGLEALWQSGPFAVLAEAVIAKVDAPASGDPRFDGAYVTLSWFVTGEQRPYDPVAGFARRVKVDAEHGALELVARLSHVDLDDAGISGGRFDKSYLGVNWWATNHWKFGAGWGRTWLRADGGRGRTDALLLRAQWVY
jgi:phosphate-selective porin OprO/OprP